MADIGELVVRMVVSLAIVLGLVAMAYGVAKRRQRGVGLAGAARRRVRASTPASLDVEARAGLARGSAAVAVRFADRIVLIGVTDGAPTTVLCEIPASEWDGEPDIPPAEEDGVPESGPIVGGPIRTPFDPNGVVSERPSFLEALRDATSRRP